MNRRKSIIGLLFISPWIIGFSIFTLYPFIYSLFLSFHKVTITATEGIVLKNVGLQNYRDMFITDILFVDYLTDELITIIIMVLVVTVFSLIFALILNMNIRFKGFIRTVFFIPVIIISGPVITELIEQGAMTVFDISEFEIVTLVTSALGDKFEIIITTIFDKMILITWYSGIQILIFLAALQKLSGELYEAAEIDGASPWECFWKITLPSLKPMILVNVIYTIVFLSTFSLNKIIKYIVDDNLFNPSTGLGYSSAMAWFYFIIIFALVIIVTLIFRIQVKPSFNKYKQYGSFSLLHPERYVRSEFLFLNKPKVQKTKKVLMGRLGTDGLLFKLFIYLLISGILFVYIYPLLFMLLTSLQSIDDLLNPSVNLIPTKLYLDNFVKSIKVLDYFNTLKSSLIISVVPSLLSVLSTSLVGYGLARFKFKGKKIVFGLILMTFIIPTQVLMIPTYLMYKNLGLLGSIFSIFLPASLSQGIKHSIFILIAYQFYSSIPKVLDEAAEIDGASPLRIFFKIALPLSIPALLVSFLFSFVWYWNETFTTSLYLLGEYKTLPIQLSKFAATFENVYPMADYVDKANRSIKMAGTLLTILPVLVIYFILQRWFVEGVDRTGITGE